MPGMTQQQALIILKTGANVFLTGEPGAGKSHTVNEFVSWLRARGVEPAVTASTGIAATHIGGMTIHSWAGIGIKRQLSAYDLDHIASNEGVVKRLRRTRILIIDEVSMLSPDTLSMVDAVCREILGQSKPFGGLQIIFVGDFFQLPPIVKKVESSEQSDDLFIDESAAVPRFAYEAAAWARANPVVCYLSEQHRQDDDAFLEILSAIRRGEFGEQHLAQVSARKVAKGGNTPASAPKLYSHNADVDRINDATLSSIGGTPKSFAMRSQGSPARIESLKKSCLSPEALFLKAGASVMFTKNNPKEGYVNGTLGKVESFNSFNGQPIVRLRSGRSVEVEPMEWSVEDSGKILARITQLPLRLAWAITVHKSQGMSLDEAVMDLSDVFEYGQGYVALSRVRSLKGLYLLGWNRRTFEVHPEVLTKDVQFREASDEAAEVFDALPNDEVKKMQENFILACGGKREASPAAKSEFAEESHADKLAKLREKHPNAYMPWSESQDQELKDLFERGLAGSAISKTLGRKPGAIRSRLIKLGLIEETA